jgi:hypothetical protein
MNKNNFGAASGDWAHFSLILGLTADLLPVVSNLNAKIAPKSTLKDLGKTPSQYRGGLVWGIVGWTSRVATGAEVRAWSKNPDYGICLQTREVRALDIDVTDPAQAAKIRDFILSQYDLPERFRANASKHLFAFRLDGDGDFAKRSFSTTGKGNIVEFLATGQQFIAAGTHPSGARYEWRGGLPDEIPSISAEHFEKLWAELVKRFAVEGTATASKNKVGRAFSISLAMERDPTAQFLIAHDLVKATDKEGKMHIVCPFEDEHTSAVGISDTSYLPMNTGGHPDGHFKCLHGHCGGRSDASFRYKMGMADATADDFDVVEDEVVERKATWADKIEAAGSVESLELIIKGGIAAGKPMGAVDEAKLLVLAGAKFRELGVPLRAEPLRKLFKPVVKRMLPDIGSNELPLETIDNLAAVCNNNNVQVRYNVIKKDDEILIADAKWSVDNVKSASITWLRSACHKVEMRTTNIKNFVTLLADRNQFNPVVEWVTSEPWDGVSRLNEFYATVQENPDECSEKMKRTVMLRWMVGAIAAAFSPSGVMVRGVLVFQGEQYTGKTRWIDALAPKEKELVKTGRSLLVHDKDSVKQILSCWISELGELDATFKKSDIAALKAFITSDMDEMRRPYAIAESQYVRRTVFAASVNEPKFLQDDTGNSRFWVLPIISVDHAHKLDMQQVWAEIHALWDEGKGEKHYLSKEEMELLNCHNETFAAPDPIFEMIRGHLDWEGFHLDTCEWKQVSDVLRWLGQNNPSKYDTILAGKAIKKLNYGHSKKVNGVRLVAVPACKISQVEGELVF